MIITLLIICLLLSFSTIYLAIKVYQFSLIIINIEDSIEESLDILNNKYKRMNSILQKPIFFDSIEVRQVVSDIKDSHDAILLIANKLTNDIGIKSDNEIEEKNDQT